MAFKAKDGDFGGNSKQHLNLSTLAYEVIRNDMFAFGEEHISGFINTVFYHYHPIAEASIALVLNRLDGELDECLSEISDNKAKKKIKRQLESKKKDELLFKINSYEKGEPFKFTLNKQNLAYLSDEESECTEEAYYKTRGSYMKAVIEEYARLPFVDRERIYFSPKVDEIQAAIRYKKQLKVVTGNGKAYSVYPYKILSDPLSTTNYLVGYSLPALQSEDEKDNLMPCSFKIAALQSVRMMKSKSAFLKERMWKQLSETISSRGVQFLVGNESEIHVRLTAAGINKYHRQTHLRPPLLREQGNGIYEFYCTTAQAEFYFFKYGRDAEILSPIELRDRFKAMYEAAARTYAAEEN